jgi:hypothetical protein
MTDRVIALEHVELEKIMLSGIMFTKRSYKDKETNEIKEINVPYVEVWYEFPQHRFCVFIDNIRSYSGVQIYHETSFISSQLTQVQSQFLKKMEDRLAFLLFGIRHELLNGYCFLRKMMQYTDIHILMQSIIQTGDYDFNKPYVTLQEHNHRPVLLSQPKMMDQLTTMVSSCKNKDVASVDDDMKQLHDTEGRLLNITLRFTGITYDDNIKIITEAKSLTFSDSKESYLVQNDHTGFVDHDITEAEMYKVYEISKYRIY